MITTVKIVNVSIIPKYILISLCILSLLTSLPYPHPHATPNLLSVTVDCAVDCLCFPKIHQLKPNLQYDGIY